MPEVLQIVPGLPPPFEGVGSYALTLAEALARLGVESSFLCARPPLPPAEGGAPPASAALVELIGEGGRSGLARRLAERGASTVLLHYVGYGFAPRGCPRWLARGLARWRRDGAGRRLVTLFHEVWSTGPPWRSSFWLGPAQRALVARLVAASDGLATSLALYRSLLAPWAGGREVSLSPVFSTVGEAAEPPPLAARPPRMALFGGAGARRLAAGELAPVLAAACRALGLEEVVDIGPPTGGEAAAIAGVPVRRLGVLPAAEAGAQLAACRAGFLAYPAPFLGKSTIFAAYSAHGLLPVCAWPPRRGGRGAGLDEPPPLWDATGPPPADPQDLARRAGRWYAGHSVALQAERFRRLLLGPDGKP